MNDNRWIDTLPKISFGCASIAGLYEAVSDQQVHDVLQTAWDNGLRFFDVAPHYGQGLAERRLGDFLRNAPSDDWILSTKVGRILTPTHKYRADLNGFENPLPFDQHFDYTYDGIMRSVEHSYQRLGLSRIDVALVHDLGDCGHGTDSPEFYHQFEASGYKALGQLKSEGAVKAVGFGTNETMIGEKYIKKYDIDLILLAGRYTLLEPELAIPMMDLCDQNGVKLIIGGVFNSGILATGPVEGARFNYQPAPQAILDKVKSIEDICNQHGIALSDAALNFPTKNKLVASVLIGTAESHLLLQNLQSFKRNIPSALWKDFGFEIT